MNFKRFWALLKARNREFFRDRAAFGWNFVFPFLIVAGFGVIFGGQSYTEYKIGLFPHPEPQVQLDQVELPDAFRNMRYLKFIRFPTAAAGLDKLKHHKIDFLLKSSQPPYEYYVSDESPKGYVLEQMFLSEVWFSLEGAPGWIKSAAQIFPLTHLLTAARKIMHDGAGLADISLEITILTLMTIAFLTIGAAMFSWNK
jgi:hypothetical protein